MPSTPFDTAHQASLRMLIGKLLPGAGAHLIAEAVAAGYGFPTHEAFGAAIRAVEAGRPAPAHDFDADRLIGRLHALGEPVGEQDEAPRFLLAAMADGPRHGPLPDREPPDGPLAQQRLRTRRLYMQVGLWEHAGSILGTAMSVAPAELKGEVAAALAQAAPHAETAAANLALALLSADGVPRDAARAASLLDPLTASREPELRAYAHNWLGHIASGRLARSRGGAVPLRAGGPARARRGGVQRRPPTVVRLRAAAGRRSGRRACPAWARTDLPGCPHDGRLRNRRDVGCLTQPDC